MNRLTAAAAESAERDRVMMIIARVAQSKAAAALTAEDTSSVATADSIRNAPGEEAVINYAEI